jgi:hypothetical protein
MVSLVGILPVLMDFMEDIKDVYPRVYSKQIKKAGNEFITEVLKHTDNIYKKMEMEDDQDLRDFYYQVDSFGIVFRNWLKEL